MTDLRSKCCGAEAKGKMGGAQGLVGKYTTTEPLSGKTVGEGYWGKCSKCGKETEFKEGE